MYHKFNLLKKAGAIAKRDYELILSRDSQYIVTLQNDQVFGAVIILYKNDNTRYLSSKNYLAVIDIDADSALCTDAEIRRLASQIVRDYRIKQSKIDIGVQWQRDDCLPTPD